MVFGIAVVLLAAPVQAGHDDDSVPDQAEHLCSSAVVRNAVNTLDGVTGLGDCDPEGSPDFRPGEQPGVKLEDVDNDRIPDAVEEEICATNPHPALGECTPRDPDNEEKVDDYHPPAPVPPIGGAGPGDVDPCRSATDWIDVVRNLVADADCDGDSNADEAEQGCNPADPEDNLRNGAEDCTLSGLLPPDESPPQEVGEHCGNGFSPENLSEFLWSILTDPDCDNKTVQEDLDDLLP